MATPPPTWNIGSVSEPLITDTPATLPPPEKWVPPNRTSMNGARLGIRPVQRTPPPNVETVKEASTLVPTMVSDADFRDQSYWPTIDTPRATGTPTSTLNPPGILRLSPPTDRCWY